MKIFFLASAIIAQCSTKSTGRGNERVAPGDCQRSCECPNGQVWSRSLEKCLSTFITDYYEDYYYADYELDLGLHTPEPSSSTTASSTIAGVSGSWGEWGSFSECKGVGQIGTKTRIRKCSDEMGEGCGWTQQNEDKPCLLRK